MADSLDPSGIPQATVVPQRRARISVIWIIPASTGPVMARLDQNSRLTR